MTTSTIPPRTRDRTKSNPNARGTSNSNDRGGSAQRRRRKEYLLEAYASDVKLVRVVWESTGEVTVEAFAISVDLLCQYEGVAMAEELPTARCYRCGGLVWFETISVDRIKAGGSYRRENIRPACDDCQSITGNEERVRRASLKVATRRNTPRRLEVVL